MSTLSKILLQEADFTYGVTERLFRLVDPALLTWKPDPTNNWMSMGQLLHHCTTACGPMLKGYLTGDWGLPEGISLEDMPAESMLPPAEDMPTVDSVEDALRRLEDDREVTRHLLEGIDQMDLLDERFTAPWGGPEVTLFQHLYSSIHHLHQHKGQLFYYLKLLGLPLTTEDLWGI